MPLAVDGRRKTCWWYFLSSILKKNPKNKEWNNNQKETAMVVVVVVAVVWKLLLVWFSLYGRRRGSEKGKNKKKRLEIPLEFYTTAVWKVKSKWSFSMKEGKETKEKSRLVIQPNYHKGEENETFEY
mmetsp:Transcript_19857/g.34899  ORF Transcript_19857/g.34899 Transcript_19857/m.34899 type:complete len:127 (-) Transcript_19857:149-529(-)